MSPVAPPSLTFTQCGLLTLSRSKAPIEHGNPVHDAWLTALRGSGGRSAAEGAEVYRRMYRLRLRQALRRDYPELAAHMGDAAFEELSDAYIQATPSTSFTLADYGETLPEFLSAQEGFEGDDRELCVELARIERIENDLLGQPRTTGLKGIETMAADAWPTARLRLAPGVRLVRLQRYRPADAQPDVVGLAIARTSRGVARHPLSSPQLDTLTALQRGEGLALALERLGAEDPQQTFRRWVSHGFFECVLPAP